MGPGNVVHLLLLKGSIVVGIVTSYFVSQLSERDYCKFTYILETTFLPIQAVFLIIMSTQKTFIALKKKKISNLALKYFLVR